MARGRLTDDRPGSKPDGALRPLHPAAAWAGPIEWVFFDAGGTLFDTLLTAERLLAALGDLAAGLDREAFAARLPRAFAALGQDHLGPPPDFRVDRRRARRRWQRLLDALVEALGVAPARAATCRAALWRAFAEPTLFPLFPEVRPALDELRRAGFRLAIVSNWERRLELLCAAHGLRSRFELVLASEQLGFAKPGRPIFEEAIQRTGCEPGRGLYVGDSLELDAQAAATAGLASVLLDRGRYYPTEAWPNTIGNLAELPTLLAPQRQAG